MYSKLQTCTHRNNSGHFFPLYSFVSVSDTIVRRRNCRTDVGQSIRPGSTEVAEFQRPAIVLTLPGGCHLTQEQYDTYQKFQVSPNIRQW